MTENGPFLRIAAREEKRGFFWKIKYLGKFGNPVGHIVRKAAEKSDPLTFERHSNLPSDYNMQFEKSASPDSLVSLEWTCRNFCKIVIEGTLLVLIHRNISKIKTFFKCAILNEILSIHDILLNC